MRYFVATRHAAFADMEFVPDDEVIDPWRYIPGAHRIGESKPDLISLLVPTRARPTEFRRMVESALWHATFPRRIEIIAYVDEDDPSAWDYNTIFSDHPQLSGVSGPRIVLSEMWNECYKRASGEILMHAGDDIVFRTPAWDSVVRQAFAESYDKLLLVHGDDMSPNTDALATHGFLHRRWVETVGYFVPPHFSSDWNDVWLTEVADMVGRRVKVPIVTEHMHYAFEKSSYDDTYRQREERGRRDDVVGIYERTAHERVAAADRLRAVMA